LLPGSTIGTVSDAWARIAGATHFWLSVGNAQMTWSFFGVGEGEVWIVVEGKGLSIAGS